METTRKLEKVSCEEYVAYHQVDPEALWLDQEVTGEELIELDPLEEDKARETLADEGFGSRHLLNRLRPYSDRLWEKVWPILKAELQQEHNGAENLRDFQERLRGAV